jgi:CysZ protein
MLKQSLQAIGAYARALQLTIRWNLWGYFVIPVLISLILGGAIFYAAYGLSDNLSAWIMQVYPFERGQAVVERASQILGGVLLVALGLILFKNLVIAFASPFMSFLSEKIERKLYGGKSPKFSVSRAVSDLVRGIRVAIRLVARELGITLVLVLIGLIPIFAPVIPFLIFIVQAYYAGFGNMDFTLERHYRVRGSVGFVRDHRGLAIGNGAVYLFLYFTVIGFMVALPLGTIAAATESLKHLRKGEKPQLS